MAADSKSAVMGTLNTNDLLTDSSKIANNKMSTRRTMALMRDYVRRPNFTTKPRL